MLPTIFETDAFRVTPCMDCDLPGYLVLVARDKKSFLSELTAQSLGELGPTLGRLEKAIQKVCNAEHVYLLRFSEGLSSVHFHLFPRNEELKNLWIASARPISGEVNGPQLFAWARLRYHVASPDMLSERTLRASQEVRNLMF